jgi:hypothetical protein
VIGGIARKARLLPTIRHFQPNPSGVHKAIASAASTCSPYAATAERAKIGVE